MGLIAALIPNPSRLFRLRSAIRGRHTVEPCADWDELVRLCEIRPVHLAILDLYATGDLTLDPLRHLKRRFPRMGTVAYVDPAVDRLRDLFDAGRSGVDALILADRDDDALSITATLEQAEARGSPVWCDHRRATPAFGARCRHGRGHPCPRSSHRRRPGSPSYIKPPSAGETSGTGVLSVTPAFDYVGSPSGRGASAGGRTAQRRQRRAGSALPVRAQPFETPVSGISMRRRRRSVLRVVPNGSSRACLRMRRPPIKPTRPEAHFAPAAGGTRLRL